ncbi:hypothetical protein MHU86_19297 [Fragilaria crotonensis]|nr:hypothetical protein MHU86_19297 [Fragilaria crotonensis]
MRQIRQFWACVSNFVTGDDEDGKAFLTSTASSVAASKMGHSKMTHGVAYSSKRLRAEESHFNAYHFAIGDTSYEMSKTNCANSHWVIFGWQCHRVPKAISSDGHNYLSSQQKELVEFGYGCHDDSMQMQQHCFDFSPGEGKSEVFIIPTIARRIGNQRSK